MNDHEPSGNGKSNQDVINQQNSVYMVFFPFRTC